MTIDIEKITKAFQDEDNRLAELPETEEMGNPFTICTNGARWLQEKFFPEAKVVGYQYDKNPSAEIGEWTLGHDFLLIENRYILDFWYKFIQGVEDCPVFIDIQTQPELVKRYYGDQTKWETLN